MAFSTITVFMSNGSSKIVTLTTTDLVSAQQAVQNMIKCGSVMDDSKAVIVPVSSVMQFVIS